MKKNYFKWLPQGICTVFLLLFFNVSNAQVAFRLLEGFGAAVLDINDSGQAVKSGGLYDFNTDTTTPVDEEATGISGINNAGDLIGTMPLERNGEMYSQPGYKKNGVWHPIGYPANSTIDAAFTLGQISENGNYVTGQMSADCCDFQSFLYNVSTGNLELLRAPNSEYGAGYTVNNNGVAGGWYDPLPEGTLRVPALMTAGSVFTSVPAALPTQTDINQVSAINNNGVAVGDRNGKPFIYDSTTGTFTEYQIPGGYDTATFTSISDNGIAVGYTQTWGGDGPDREGIIYNPTFGPQPIFIKDILAANGVEIGTFDGKLGTPIAISPDGNFVGGWENGFFMFASGWIINFDGMLFDSCFILCPEDITTVSLSGPKTVNYSINLACGSNPGANLVLVSGPASGSDFPVGTTQVVHNLLDENGLVIDTCTFNVTVSDQYCIPSELNPEAITLVNVADINNTSAADSTASFEDYTTITGNVTAGQSYEVRCQGFTGGPFPDFFTVYADWNHDGEFGNGESTQIGFVEDSTGEDGQTAVGNLNVPADAYIGNTLMRVVKTYGDYTVSGCEPGSGYGQVEDYTLAISPALSTTGFNGGSLKFYPNPVSDVLNISGKTTITDARIINLLGQEMMSQKVNGKNIQLNLSGLTSGSYLVKITSEKNTDTLKIIKQ